MLVPVLLKRVKFRYWVPMSAAFKVLLAEPPSAKVSVPLLTATLPKSSMLSNCQTVYAADEPDGVSARGRIAGQAARNSTAVNDREAVSEDAFPTHTTKAAYTAGAACAKSSANCASSALNNACTAICERSPRRGEKDTYTTIATVAAIAADAGRRRAAGKACIPQPVRSLVLRLNEDHAVGWTIPCHRVPVSILLLMQAPPQLRSDDRRLEYGFVIQAGAQDDAIVDDNIRLASRDDVGRDRNPGGLFARLDDFGVGLNMHDWASFVRRRKVPQAVKPLVERLGTKRRYAVGHALVVLIDCFARLAAQSSKTSVRRRLKTSHAKSCLYPRREMTFRSWPNQSAPVVLKICPADSSDTPQPTVLRRRQECGSTSLGM